MQCETRYFLVACFVSWRGELLLLAARQEEELASITNTTCYRLVVSELSVRSINNAKCNTTILSEASAVSS